MSGVRIVQGSDTSNDQETVLANSAVIDFQDPVYLDASGFLNQITTSSRVEGFYEEQRKTVTSDNQTVALAKGQWDGNLYDVVVEMTADQAATQADVGLYFNVAIASNVITANLPCNATTGQFQLIDFDPDRDGTTTKVRAKVAFPEQLAFKINS